MQDAIINHNYHKEGLLEAATDGMLSRSNDLYRLTRKKNWQCNFDSKDKNMHYKMGVEDGKRFVQFTQHNVEQIRREAKDLREKHKLEIEGQESWKLMFPFAKYPAMHLPKVLMQEISHNYFDGKLWDQIKRDPTERNQFYMVVNRYYSDFVVHPSGQIPIQVKVPFPRSVAEKRIFAHGNASKLL